MDRTPPTASGRSRAARPARAPPASSAAVKAGDGTIGYADESQAGDLGVAAIKVGEEYNAPTAEGAAKVLADVARASRAAAPIDMAIDVDRTTTESGAYPLIAHVVPHRLPDLRRRRPTPTWSRATCPTSSPSEGQQAAADAGRLGPAGVLSLQQEAAAIVDKISAK